MRFFFLLFHPTHHYPRFMTNGWILSKDLVHQLPTRLSTFPLISRLEKNPCSQSTQSNLCSNLKIKILALHVKIYWAKGVRYFEMDSMIKVICLYSINLLGEQKQLTKARRMQDYSFTVYITGGMAVEGNWPSLEMTR